MSTDENTTAAQGGAGRQQVGGFEILSKIGQGGMGAVFRARQISVDRVVALKVLPPKLAKNPDFVARFLREARSAARLSHPNIVQGIDAGEASGYYYFAMEFVDGRTLKDIVQADGPLPEPRALAVIRDVARALDCAHDAGLVHRDVKPENVLVTADGAVKLADLGLAREAVRSESTVTQVGQALGTPDFISPEQVRGDAEIDGRTDIYSLGATLYYLLTGAAPYAGQTAAEIMSKHLTKPVPDVRRVNREVTAGAAALIRRAMAKDRGKRYPDAKTLGREAERLLAGKGAVKVGAPAVVATRHELEESKLEAARRMRRKAAPWYVRTGLWLVMVAMLTVWMWCFAVTGGLNSLVRELGDLAGRLHHGLRPVVDRVSVTALLSTGLGIAGYGVLRVLWVKCSRTREGRRALWWVFAVLVGATVAAAFLGLSFAAR